MDLSGAHFNEQEQLEALIYVEESLEDVVKKMEACETLKLKYKVEKHQNGIYELEVKLS